MSSKGRSVIITGAASGVALSAAGLLGQEGWTVVPVDRAADAVHQAAEQLAAAGVSVTEPVVADISTPTASLQAVEAATAGGLRLAGLVNAAAATFLGSIDSITVDDLDGAFAVNVRGTFMMMKAVLPAMRAGGTGSIVNIGSVDSFLGEDGTLAYCATKAAVQNMTRAAAMDLSPDRIRVNCVCPGIIDTPFFRASFEHTPEAASVMVAANRRQPLGVLDPTDVGEAIRFLISDASRGMTGSSLVVDGGMSASWRSGPLT